MLKKAITFVLIVLMIFSMTSNCFASGDIITIVVNGESVSTDVNPFILSGRTMVPARVIAEAFGAEVKWHGNGRVVLITE